MAWLCLREAVRLIVLRSALHKFDITTSYMAARKMVHDANVLSPLGFLTI
jgi:hypothetical protein